MSIATAILICVVIGQGLAICLAVTYRKLRQHRPGNGPPRPRVPEEDPHPDRPLLPEDPNPDRALVPEEDPNPDDVNNANGNNNANDEQG